MLKFLSGFALAGVSIVIFLLGWVTLRSTEGVVRGTEFTLLIAILNKIGWLMLWFAAFAAWSIASHGEKKSASPAPSPNDGEHI
jgi:hypothetical protein